MSIESGIVIDENRHDRLGFDEAIFCAQKTINQIEHIISLSEKAGRRRLFTRLEEFKFRALASKFRQLLNYDPISQIATLGEPLHRDIPFNIAIVSAGSSDASVVAEAQQTLEYYGISCLIITDVGVAGIWRLMDNIEKLKQMSVVIAVAGMDAALPTVLAGLIPASIIGVPTSTGYGIARAGETALSAMLASCGPGLTVVNIDNGYGAACAALRMVNSLSISKSKN